MSFCYSEYHAHVSDSLHIWCGRDVHMIDCIHNMKKKKSTPVCWNMILYQWYPMANIINTHLREFTTKYVNFICICMCKAWRLEICGVWLLIWFICSNSSEWFVYKWIWFVTANIALDMIVENIFNRTYILNDMDRRAVHCSWLIAHSLKMIYILVVFNVALTQESDLRIDRRQVVFLCRMHDTPGSLEPNLQQTECPLTSRHPKHCSVILSHMLRHTSFVCFLRCS